MKVKVKGYSVTFVKGRLCRVGILRKKSLRMIKACTLRYVIELQKKSCPQNKQSFQLLE